MTPRLLYGTAWKEERTAALVATALAAGFRGIDTANQRRHYHEAGVGAALAGALQGGQVRREELFLQSKFTYVEGQDARLPYDPAAPYAGQVRQSFASSLEHLGVERLDSYLLHGPRTHRGLAASDREVWRTMEELQQVGRVTHIGVSNVTAEQLAGLCRLAAVQPAFVQNRCFARLGWDREVRGLPRRRGRLPGLLAPHRQPRRAGEPDGRPRRGPPRRHPRPGAVPLRSSPGDGGPHRHHRAGAHARGPCRRGLRAAARRGGGDRRSLGLRSGFVGSRPRAGG